jgi:pentatricopeptide repeat protein
MISQNLTDKAASSLLTLGGLLPTTIAIALGTVLLAFGSITAQVAAPEPPELADLRSRFQADSQTVVKPLQDRYVLQLQILMRSLTQRGDLDGALAVKQELKTEGFGAAAAV